MDFKKYSNKINFDMQVKLLTPVSAKEGDIKSRYLELTLFNNNQSVNLENCTVKIYAEKPDGHHVFNTCEILTHNKVLIELTSQMLAVPGVLKCELMIINADQDKLTSQVFNINVLKSVNSDEAVESTNEFGVLTELINDVEMAKENIGVIGSIVESADEKISIINNTIQLAITKNDTLIGTITNSNNANSTLNSTISNANSTNSTLNSTISNANRTNGTLNTTIGNANTAKNELQDKIDKAENVQIGGAADLVTNTALTNKLKNYYTSSKVDSLFSTTNSNVNTNANNIASNTSKISTNTTNINNRLPVTQYAGYMTMDPPKSEYNEYYVRTSSDGLLPKDRKTGVLGLRNNEFREIHGINLFTENHHIYAISNGDLVVNRFDKDGSAFIKFGIGGSVGFNGPGQNPALEFWGEIGQPIAKFWNMSIDAKNVYVKSVFMEVPDAATFDVKAPLDAAKIINSIKILNSSNGLELTNIDESLIVESDVITSDRLPSTYEAADETIKSIDIKQLLGVLVQNVQDLNKENEKLKLMLKER